jgi:hypothetical protein
LLAKKGIIEYEEEMKGKIWYSDGLVDKNLTLAAIDVVLPNPGRQRVMVACVPSDEILAAAAAGPGTTLGQSK